MTTWRTAVVGDIHGHLAEMQDLLRREGFLNAAGHWDAGHAHLWFMGDYTDRGPDGVDVIDQIIQLQTEAAQAGGMVGALLGNHDLIALNAFRFRHEVVPGFERQGTHMTFHELWQANAGGVPQDAARMQPQHLAWLAALPALARLGDTLLMHADSTFYLKYGRGVDEVNAEIHRLLHGGTAAQVDRLEERFARRREFLPQLHGEDVAAEHLNLVLDTFGANRLVHGHTPIFRLLERSAGDITEAWTYQGGRCVNVDHCLYAGGPGFVFDLN